MATAVESPGITSAKEEAAAILFARPTPIPTATAPNPVPETVQMAPKPPRPNLAGYHEPEPIPYQPVVLDTSHLRPYESFDVVETAVEPQVIRPYLNSNDYLSSAVAATSIPTSEVTTTAEVATTTTTAPKSALDTPLEEDTQYVVKFKKSTIVAVAVIAAIFLLMAVLCVVNIVSLVTASAEVNALLEESSTLRQSINQEAGQLAQIREEVLSNNTNADYHPTYVTLTESATTTTKTVVPSSFFDWLCHGLSQLFG